MNLARWRQRVRLPPNPSPESKPGSFAGKLREIELLEQCYAEGGLSDSEAAELRTRAEVLESLVNAKRSHLIK